MQMIGSHLIRLAFVLLLFSFEATAQSHKAILVELLSKCMSASNAECKSVLVGSDQRKALLLSALSAMKANQKFSGLYMNSYGADKYNDFVEAINLNVSMIDPNEYELVRSTVHSAEFANQSGETLAIVKQAGEWKADLNNSTFSGMGGAANDQQLRFFNLLAAALVDLSNRIVSGAAQEEVFDKAGMYLIAIMLPFTPGEKRVEYEALLSELGGNAEALLAELNAVLIEL